MMKATEICRGGSKKILLSVCLVILVWLLRSVIFNSIINSIS